MAMLARLVNCSIRFWWSAVGVLGSRYRMAKLPRTRPFLDEIGVDQHARMPCCRATAHHPDDCHLVSDMMSDAITCWLRLIAVEQAPDSAFRGRLMTASTRLAGRLGAAPNWRRVAPGSAKRMLQ